MKLWFMAAVLLASCLPTSASALDLKNIRLCYGPHGATRQHGDVQPSDIIFMRYDIEGLAIDAKTGEVNYVTTLEIRDEEEKALFERVTRQNEVPGLGGTRMPGDFQIALGAKQKPGRYSIRLTVKEKYANSGKRFTYPVTVTAPTFGMIQVQAPAVGAVGGQYTASFALVNSLLDVGKVTNATVIWRILDSDGKTMSRKEQMVPSDPLNNGFAPMSHSINLNRAGRFTMAIVALDHNAKKRIELQVPLTVLDAGSFSGTSLEWRSEPVTVRDLPLLPEVTCEARRVPRRMPILRGFRCR